MLVAHAHSAPTTVPTEGVVAPRGVSGTEVEVHRRIDDVDPELWDALVPPDEIQATHAFVKACQDARVESSDYWHLLVRHRGGLIGVATLCDMPVRLDLLSTGPVRRTIRVVRRARPTFLQPRVLFCGLPVSAGRHCIAFRSPGDAPRVLAVVADIMAEVGREIGAKLHCVKEFTPDEATMMDGLRDHGFFRADSIPTFAVHVPWRSFDEYLGGMRAGYRRQVRATRRLAHKTGLRVRRVTDYGDECSRIHPLYAQVLDRAEFQLERLNEAFFRNLNAYLGPRSDAILVERDQELLAAAILLRSPCRLTFFMAGIEYASNRESGAYLHLVTEVVAEAIRSGTPVLEMGQTSPWLKTRLGGHPEDRHIYFRCPSPSAHALFQRTATLLFPPSRTPRRRVFRRPAGR